MRSPLAWWRHRQSLRHADAVLDAAADRAKETLDGGHQCVQVRVNDGQPHNLFRCEGCGLEEIW